MTKDDVTMMRDQKATHINPNQATLSNYTAQAPYSKIMKISTMYISYSPHSKMHIHMQDLFYTFSVERIMFLTTKAKGW